MTVRVLLVDDEPDAGELFKQNFRKQIKSGEFEIVFVQSGEAALDYLSDDNPNRVNVILSDIKMPGISGVELLENVKPRWPLLPVVMLSAISNTSIETEVKRKGADGFHPKPIDFSILTNKLNDLTQDRVN